MEVELDAHLDVVVRFIRLLYCPNEDEMKNRLRTALDYRTLSELADLARETMV